MIAIIGSNGMLGQDVVEYCKINKLNYVGFDYPDIDITKMNLIRDKITKDVKIIINCAAYTAVDKAEGEELKALSVNGLGSRNLAIRANEIEAKIAHISTDYVFDGFEKDSYDEMDLPNPINVYGKSKLVGENFVREMTNTYFILRTSWLFGHKGNNFIKTMLRLVDKEEVKVVNDQFGAPTYTKDLVEVLFKLISTEKYGTYHVTSEGRTTWYEFAEYIFQLNGIVANLIPCTSEEFPTLAKRPKNSELKSLMLEAENINLLPDWREAVKKYFIDEAR